jgi:hypothetical protein
MHFVVCRALNSLLILENNLLMKSHFCASMKSSASKVDWAILCLLCHQADSELEAVGALEKCLRKPLVLRKTGRDRS